MHVYSDMFVYQNNVNEINLPSITIKRHADEHSSSKFDLTITVYRNNGKFEVDFEYCTDLFKEDTNMLRICVGGFSQPDSVRLFRQRNRRTFILCHLWSV